MLGHLLILLHTALITLRESKSCLVAMGFFLKVYETADYFSPTIAGGENARGNVDTLATHRMDINGTRLP